MVELEGFGEQQPLMQRLLAGVGSRLTHLLGKPTSMELVGRLDDEMLARMLELEEEVFRIEDNVYTGDDIRECLAEEDSLLVLMRIGGQVEGYVFGYKDDPDDPEVEGSDYFVDTAVVSLAYEAKGIGSLVGLMVLYMLYLLGYRRIGITTEPRDKTGRELVRFYQKLGFSEARAKRPGNAGMNIELNDVMAQNLRAQLLGPGNAGN